MPPRVQPQRSPSHRPRGRSRSTSPARQSEIEDCIRVIPRDRDNLFVPTSQIGRQARREDYQTSSNDPTLTNNRPARRKGYEINNRLWFPGFPPEDQPVETDLPLEEFVRKYPNHLSGEHLKRLVEANWTANRIINHMHPDARHHFMNRTTCSQPANALTKRLSVMRAKMVKERATIQPPDNPPRPPAPRSPNPTRKGRVLPSRHTSRPIALDLAPYHRASAAVSPLSALPPPPPPSSSPSRRPRLRSPPPSSLYMYRATFKVYVPYDPENPNALSEPTELNIYLPEDPPHITPEDPLGVLYNQPPRTAPATHDRGPSHMPGNSSRRSSVFDPQTQPLTASMGTKRKRRSPPRFGRSYTTPDGFGQAFDYPVDSEQWQPPQAPVAVAEDEGFSEEQESAGKYPLMGIIGPRNYNEEAEAMFRNPRGPNAFRIDANTYRSPNRGIYDTKKTTPPSGRRRSS